DQCSLADASQPASFDVVRSEAAAVVDDTQDDAFVAALEREQHLARLGVTSNVGEALLGDPVDHELDGGVERGQVALELALDAQVRALLEAGREALERTREPEVVERFGAEFLRQSADVVETRLDDLLRFIELELLF